MKKETLNFIAQMIKDYDLYTTSDLQGVVEAYALRHEENDNILLDLIIKGGE